MSKLLKFIIFINGFVFILSDRIGPFSSNFLTPKSFMFWPNATVPFFINPDHFDHEQSMVIMTTLSVFALKTCLKFAPVMAAPAGDDRVLVFQNPEGTRRCKIPTAGHSVYEPHTVLLGYECLQNPQLDMIVMKSLGFPFEHNRASRDIFIEVLVENIETGYLDLFTKESTLPAELRSLPYDINSVMHFGERDFSKNGHRTIIFKDRNAHQNRVGLSTNDLRKISIVYGPECQKRDRQEKIDLCQSYPGVVRRKRHVAQEPKSLRVNSDITPPKPAAEESKTTQESLRVNPDITPPKIAAEESKTTQESLRINPDITPPKSAADESKTTEESLRVNPDITPPKPAAENSKTTQESFRVNPDITPPKPAADESKTTEESLRVNPDITPPKPAAENSKTTQESFRVNPDITPPKPAAEESKTINEKPAEVHTTADYINSLKELGIENAVQVIVEHAYKVSSLALQNARHLYCNASQNESKTHSEDKKNATDLLGVIEVIADYAKSVVDNAVSNLTIFCGNSENFEQYQRQGMCNWNDNSNRCRQTYRSTKSGPVRYSTQHRPVYIQSTKHYGHGKKFQGYRREESIDEGEKSNINKKESVIEVVIEDATTQLNALTEVDDSDKKNSIKNDQKINTKINIEQVDISNLETETAQVFNNIEMTDSKNGLRKKRDLVENVEKREDIVDLRHNKTVQDDMVVTDSPHNVNSLSTKSGSVKARNNEHQFYQGRRFRVKNPKGKNSKKDWEESDISVEKTIVKYDTENTREEDDIDGKELENAKKSQRLPKKRKNKRKLKSFVPRTVTLSKLNAEFYNERKWPGGVVRYVLAKNPSLSGLVQYHGSGISDDLEDVRRRLEEVNAILQSKTCVKLMEITEEETKEHEDYLVIDTSPDYVTGRVGGKQNFGSIELFQGGQHRQHAAMLVMAMLGFYFEVARHDRDRYIRVHLRHIRPDKLHHFEKIREDATLPLPYDYRSGAHPAWQFWRKLGKTGISTVATYKDQDLDGNVMRTLGQNQQLLSDIDLIKINSVYGIKCFKNTRSKGKSVDRRKQ